MQTKFTRVLFSGVAVAALAIALSGCGTQPSTTSGPAAATTGSAETNNNPISSQQQLKSIDLKTSKGQAEINSQIDKNLNSLDQSLNALDNSMGQL